MPAILFVKVKSDLALEELKKRMEERRRRFLEVPGLIQKFYGRDDKTGAFCGIYFFEDQASLEAYRASELAKSIPAAYEAVDARLEAFDVLFSLRPERGPVSI